MPKWVPHTCVCIYSRDIDVSKVHSREIKTLHVFSVENTGVIVLSIK